MLLNVIKQLDVTVDYFVIYFANRDIDDESSISEFGIH